MENFRTFLNNFIDFFFFGAKLYRKGTCDKPMDGEYHYDENSENKGYTSAITGEEPFCYLLGTLGGVFSEALLKSCVM